MSARDDILRLVRSTGRCFVLCGADGRVVDAASLLRELRVTPVGQALPVTEDGFVCGSVCPPCSWKIVDRLDVGDGHELLLLRFAPRAPLQVSVLGGFRVRDARGRVYAEGPERNHPWECLLLLCTQMGQPVPRATIGRAMWPYDDNATQRENLKQVLRRLRQRAAEIIGPDMTVVHALPGGMLQLNLHAVSFDLGDLLMLRRLISEWGAIGEMELARAGARAAFTFWLDGNRPLDDEDLQATPLLAEMRENYELAVAHALEVLADSFSGAKDQARAIEISRRAGLQAPRSSAVGLLIVRMLYRAYGLSMARWGYEEFYAQSSESPLPFEQVVQFERGDLRRGPLKACVP